MSVVLSVVLNITDNSFFSKNKLYLYVSILYRYPTVR